MAGSWIVSACVRMEEKQKNPLRPTKPKPDPEESQPMARKTWKKREIPATQTELPLFTKTIKTNQLQNFCKDSVSNNNANLPSSDKMNQTDSCSCDKPHKPDKFQSTHAETHKRKMTQRQKLITYWNNQIRYIDCQRPCHCKIKQLQKRLTNSKKSKWKSEFQKRLTNSKKKQLKIWNSALKESNENLPLWASRKPYKIHNFIKEIFISRAA